MTTEELAERVYTALRADDAIIATLPHGYGETPSPYAKDRAITKLADAIQRATIK